MFRGEQIENLAIIRRRLGVLAELLKDRARRDKAATLAGSFSTAWFASLSRLFGLLFRSALAASLTRSSVDCARIAAAPHRITIAAS